MHTTSTRYGNREVVIIHNGDWSGDCEFKVFPFDVDDPKRYDNAKPLIEFKIEGYQMVRVALNIVGPKLMSAAERFIEQFFDDRSRFGKPTLFDLITKG